ncbi:MAG: tripartite tricarboxylate transporter TctB family protein [Gammaproteobacteria bacterium]|jgi:hypothetical protein
MKGRIGNISIAAILLLFPLVLLLLGQFHWDYRPNVIMFPWMTGALVMFTAIWLFIRSLLVPVDELDKEGEVVGTSDDPRTSLIKRLLWMISVYPLCYALGLIIGLILFTLAYTSYHRLPWWQRMLSAFIVFVIVYIGFYTLLGVSLPINPVWMR